MNRRPAPRHPAPRHLAPRDGEGRVRCRAFGFEIASDIEFPQRLPADDPGNAPPADVVFRFGNREEFGDQPILAGDRIESTGLPDENPPWIARSSGNN